jgi:hypothetical protein
MIDVIVQILSAEMITYVDVNIELVLPKESDDIVTTRYDICNHHEFAEINCIGLFLIRLFKPRVIRQLLDGQSKPQKMQASILWY